MTELDFWLWLSLKKRMSASKMERLLNIFDTPKTIFNMSKEQLSSYKALDRKTVLALADKSLDRVYEVKEQCRKCEISILTYDSKCYPKNLRHISAPPYVLYTKSKTKINLNEYIRIAMVGNRIATEYGKSVARRFSEELAKNSIVVVSGMADGIDAASHRGAIQAGGITVGVMGCGLDKAYPTHHTELMHKILETGMAISEYPPGEKPEKFHFPERNRIISGISQGTLVVEAPRRSGSLITANYAIDQDRDLFAVPGDITRERSEGTNNLLKEYAIAVTSANDIVEHYSFEYAEIKEIKKLQKEKGIIPPKKEEKTINEILIGLTEEEKHIITKLSATPKNFEHLQSETGFPADKLASLITMLEIKGKIRTHPGKNFTLNT